MNSNSMLSFNPVFPLWIILLSTALLFAFLLWKEFQRKQKFLLLRIVAQVFILISILGLALRPEYKVEKKTSGIVLLTPDYNKSVVDSLLTNHPDLRLIHTNETERYRNSQVLDSYFKLSEEANKIHFIVGEGLPEHALQLMKLARFQFLSQQSPAGIHKLQIPKSVKVNQPSVITGRIKTENETTITLYGPGGKEDSVKIKANTTAPFSLKLNPKQAGLFVYTITWRDNNGTKTEQIPVEVLNEQPFSILILQKFPSFEVRQLKNFLAEKSHKLTLRYQVSKNNYRFEYANTPSVRVVQLSSSMLQSFDLLIIDSDALNELSKAEKNSLEESIHNGLGMILLPGSAAEKDQVRERYLPIKMKKALKDTVQMTINNKLYTLPVLPLQVTEGPSVFFITKNKSRIFSVYTYAGLGKTAIQLLQETYRIALEGNTEGYASIWAPLVEKTSRTKNDRFKISLRNKFPVYPDEPIRAEVISTTDEQPSILDGSTPIPITEHISIDNTWLAHTWAGKPGWHTLSADSSILQYFVSEPNSWKSLRSANHIQETTIVASNTTEILYAETTPERRKIPAIVFFVLFLLASGFVWIAPKI